MRSWPFRVGFGEDAHRLEAGRRLVLGGVEIPDAPQGAVAHSDGDAVLHVVADALLSGLALGDIGQYFPDTAAEWRGVESRVIVARALELVRERGWVPVNVAVVVTLDRPKLGPLRAQIAQRVAALLDLPAGDVGISFKTSEGLAPTYVQTRATVLLARVNGE
ncbi:2-C-methyl-D-erythritol 2,4-cyclodiphosphate synthase [Deinococcus taeanensis]|uniref:2-C-methyl-D-erythritol 2,4-cyclodiphosphate synthase n=1 Tax=Deinococcus taeanensis TaxID=2737050 RepID=UPI001CDC975F|nr:2-C-methyl-D-erythritol 2,4-cyclodiphosphate synthase [Deinococcus taeanensis]UBV43020.1 2-C-methyl-D-erythritol 2,4-cyclodiphosphate synthase [Deinococcus taeanensis]